MPVTYFALPRPFFIANLAETNRRVATEHLSCERVNIYTTVKPTHWELIRRGDTGGADRG
jgi:hypothetical protein